MRLYPLSSDVDLTNFVTRFFRPPTNKNSRCETERGPESWLGGVETNFKPSNTKI